jgi:CRP-like cAMP-binding protein
LKNTLDTIKSVYPLNELHLNLLLKELKVLHLPKGQLIIQKDKVEQSLYFIEQGAAMAHLDGLDHRIIFWFGMEGDVMLSYNSYINKTPGYENIELLEDSQVYEISTAVLSALYNQHTELANWGRKLAELELIKTEKRFISRLFKPAKERYEELCADYPALIQRIQLGYIASYLGVTQVTLSRIRAKIK